MIAWAAVGHVAELLMLMIETLMHLPVAGSRTSWFESPCRLGASESLYHALVNVVCLLSPWLNPMCEVIWLNTLFQSFHSADPPS